MARRIALAASRPAATSCGRCYLLRGSALEQADRWPEAKAELRAGAEAGARQPLLLNFLGYAKLERGEDLDAAEAMIRKASALRPDDASITDSLGWAQYKRGRLPEAIETLQRAAAATRRRRRSTSISAMPFTAPAAGIEARFAWRAALVTAEDEVASAARRPRSRPG